MARPGEPRTSPRRLEARQRQAQALALRLAGAEYPEIAQKLGYKAGSGAYRAVEAALRDGLRANVSHELMITLRRLNRLLLAAWQRALAGEVPMMAEARALIAERAKLLGLYPAPGSRRQEHIDEDLLRQEARQIARRMGQDEEAAVAEVELLLRESRQPSAP